MFTNYGPLNSPEVFNAVKIGIEYTTDSQTILRTGIQYCEFPLPGFSPHSTFTYGFGKKYHSIQIDAGGYYKMIKYLTELYPQKVPLYDYSDFHIVITGKDYFLFLSLLMSYW